MASGVPASDKRGSSFFFLQSHGEGVSRDDGRRTARVARRRRRRGIKAAHRRAGSRARGEDATLSLPSRMPSPTACRVSSLITLHSYVSKSRAQTSLANEPQSHGQPKKRSSDAALTGEVALVVHLHPVGMP